MKKEVKKDVVVEQPSGLRASAASSRIPKKKVRFWQNQRVIRTFVDVLLYILLVAMCVAWIFPIVWLIANALRIESTGPVAYLFPRKVGLDNFKKLFTTEEMPYLRWFLNTLIVATFSSIISTTVVLLTSYTFSRLNFKGRKGLMKFLMILGMFPRFMSMIAIFHILKAIGLLPTDTRPVVPVSNYLISLILVGTSGAAMGYLVSKGYFDTISKSIDEAAEIDGANKAQIFWHIILPLSKPILIYTALGAFMGPWGDYIFVATITRGKREAWNIARGLYDMINGGLEKLGKYFTLFCAGAVLISVPITILFVFMQRYYVSGVTGGAVKG